MATNTNEVKIEPFAAQRRCHDRRRARYLQRIVRALDRAESTIDGTSAVYMVGSIIVTLHESAEKFLGWPAEAVRNVVLAHAQNAPLEQLRKMARAADAEVRWLEWHDAEGWYEGQNYAPLFPSLAEARRWAS